MTVITYEMTTGAYSRGSPEATLVRLICSGICKATVASVMMEELMRNHTVSNTVGVCTCTNGL